MSDDDIDLDRVISDPDYRRRVIEYLNIGGDEADGAMSGPQPAVEGSAEHDRRDQALG